MAGDPTPLPAAQQEHSPDEYQVQGLPGITFVPARCSGLGPAASSLVEAFGRDRDLWNLPATELHAAVAFQAELAVEKMEQSNTAIRRLDPVLQDDFLRETVLGNEAFIVEYAAGIAELRGNATVACGEEILGVAASANSATCSEGAGLDFEVEGGLFL
eukprot:CAMPEP_0117557250 /NCGR_PEP_ID=MMETSP0784-20121206/52229_1 /TAXON_ID=39447 /ORGANISM="" /LENGTH=158 /DNA_ID=CAMNT_0005354553 /DNA_START=6 /DNA_END=482 /DNA_ORIENTATION=+